MLLVDGHIVYSGSAKKSVKYFASIGYDCPRYANPADFYMRLLTLEFPKAQKDNEKIELFLFHYIQKIKPLMQE